MKRRPRIYPLFLPHAGCPFTCVYCNQRAVVRQAVEGEIFTQFDQQLSTIVEDARQASSPGELAFFGGTFTALPVETMLRLLNAVTPFIGEGLFTGIRFSTRPDYMSREVCDLLSEYPVRTVELGVQSLSDKVLAASHRGYSVETVERAAETVRQYGWALGIQLMVGLPGETESSFLVSVSRTIALKPKLVRIYPTLVLKGTALAYLYHSGAYEPLSLDNALSSCAKAYDAFLQAEIPVARMGLHADSELEKPGNIVAGPYHPAFGYLVRVRWWRDRVDSRLRDFMCRGHNAIVRVPTRLMSEVIGPDRSNIAYWREKWELSNVRVECSPRYTENYFECECL